MLIIFFQILHKGKDLFEILSLLRIFWGDLKVLLFGNLTKQFLSGLVESVLTFPDDADDKSHSVQLA